MKILLLGEYSNVHATLAQGLRALGHTVTVASNGDFWKDYPRDISLVRKKGKFGGWLLWSKVISLLPKWRGFDVVQLINPMFLELKAERILPIYRYLKRHNRRIVLGAFGMDWYWVHECIVRKPLRYSDFNIGDKLRTNPEALTEQADWISTAKGSLNRLIANECNGIVAGLYEYWVCYHPYFPQKTRFIPFPIVVPQDPDTSPASTPHDEGAPRDLRQDPLRIFIGINRTRNAYKGTDIMLRAAQDICDKYGALVRLQVAESVPFAQYRKMLRHNDVLLDQLYSYTPSMNPLEAMAYGVICIGGGEEENYEILGEKELRPILNILPNYESVYQALESLVLHPERIATLRAQSIQYIRRHHDHIKVAQQYLDFYQGLPAAK